MTDIVAQVAKYLAEKTGRTYGTDVFYYQMPDSVDDCVVVQRNKLNVSVPVQIDADVYTTYSLFLIHLKISQVFRTYE